MVEETREAVQEVHIPNGNVQRGIPPPTQQNMELDIIRQKLENFQASVLKDVEKRMSNMIDDMMQEMRQHELQTHEFQHFAKSSYQKHSDTWKNRKLMDNTDASNIEKINHQENSSTEARTTQKVAANHKTGAKRKRRALPDKVFMTRESYLTALLEVDHMKAIYHIFFIILLVLFLNSICHDYFVEGRVNFGLGTFKAGLKGMDYVLGIWLIQHICVFVLYYAFKLWAVVRSRLHRQKPMQRFWSHSCLIIYASSQLVFCYVPSVLSLKLNLPFVTSSVLTLETIRLLMKMHAFVRTNAARVTAGKFKSDDKEVDGDTDDASSEKSNRKYGQVPVPPFKCYLYFLFAPTLLYRDQYPRTSQIRVKFALSRFVEVVGVAFVYSYIFERHIKVHFHSYGLEQMDAPALLVKLFGMVMPSMIIFLCGFYLILHAWLNFTGELLRFGDRMFYKDWWTSSSYDAYYRNWNVVVHDWLYEYVYKDFYNHICKGSKLIASLMVFLTSALAHELVIGIGLQVFFPMMLLFFGCIGVFLVFVTRNAPRTLGNIILWATLIIGNSLMFCLYCMEYYASVNCSKTYGSLSEFIRPALLNCYRS